jgi:hypothetical protein
LWTRVVETEVNAVHLQKDLDLTKSAFCNFQKLRYFGLIAHVKDRPGYWLVTRRGALFIHGKQRVNQRLLIFRNHIQERSMETVGILEVMACETYWPLAEWFIPAEAPQHIEQRQLF